MVVLIRLTKTVIIVEIGRDTFQAVEVANQHNGIELVRYAIRNLPADGINSEWIKKIWEQEHFSRNRVILLLPPDLVNYKTVVLPTLPLTQFEAAIQVELNSNNHSEIISIIGYYLWQDMYHVKVALVKDDLLCERLCFLEQAGLKVEWSGVRARGIENFINFNQGFFEEPNTDLAYLDITEEQTEFGVFKEDEILYRRDFAPGSTELILAEGQSDTAITADFLEELRLSIASYRSAFSGGLKGKLWTFGYVDHLAELLNRLMAELDLQVFIPTKSKLAGVLTDKHTPQMAPLIGLALEASGFLHREFGCIFSEKQKEALQKKKMLKDLFKIVLIGTGILAGIFFGMQANIEHNTKVDNWLQQQAPRLIKLQYLDRSTSKNIQKINELEDWLVDRNQELEFLRILQANLPVGTKIIDLTIENGLIKDLSGTTPTVSWLLSKLKGVPGLDDLRLKGTITKGPEGEIFHLEGTIGNKKQSKATNN